MSGEVELNETGEVTGEVEEEFDVDELLDVIDTMREQVQELKRDNALLRETIHDYQIGTLKSADQRRLERYESMWRSIVNVVELPDAMLVKHRVQQLVADELFFVKQDGGVR